MKSESQIQKEILDWLKKKMYNDRSVWVSRLSTGHAFKNQFTVIELCPTGTPDILCLYKGRFIGIEVKAKGGRQSSEQKDMAKLIKKAGGEYHIVRSLKKLKEIIV